MFDVGANDVGTSPTPGSASPPTDTGERPASEEHVGGDEGGSGGASAGPGI